MSGGIVSTFWTFYGPGLFRIMKRDGLPGYPYSPNFLESISDRIVGAMRTAISTVYWCSPVVVIMMYRRDYFTIENLPGLSRVALSLFAIYSIAYFCRGIGRLSNSDYRGFIHTLVEARSNPNMRTKAELARYDFEFWAWPVDFRWDSISDVDKKKAKGAQMSKRKAQVAERTSLPCRVLGYLAMHTFGQKMIYPGGTSLMNYILSSMLAQGRAALIEDKGGKRAKILTEDNNELDTMFVDRRGSSYRYGDILVITSEGNGGFYEMGCSGTPVEQGYSVLGWNRPGFGGSTGSSWPDSEEKATEAVMSYAINKLGFEPRNIALFAWSIGGYSAAIMARNYPDLKFVVLDATFDDLVPLAISKMPESWGGLVASSIRSHIDLNVAEKLIEYQGPVLLIRRTRDEMITTNSPPDRHPNLISNRGNNLLIKLLQHRYPTIVDGATIPVMRNFLSRDTFSQVEMLQEFDVEYDVCNELVSTYAVQHGVHFPMRIPVDNENLKERVALFLITMHMENFESTHNTPLPVKFLHKPWIPGAHV